jgi:hypothetical protein
MRHPISQRVTPRKQAAPAAPPRSRRARIFLALLAPILLLAAGYAALLWWTSGQMRLALDNWAAQRRAQGWVVEHGPATWVPDPRGAVLRLPGLRLAQSGTAWQAEDVRLTVAPWAPDRLRLQAGGAQSLALGGPAMPLRTATLQGELLLNGTAPPRSGQVALAAAVLDTPAGPLALDSGQLSFDSTARPGATAVEARLHGLGLPLDTPLGRRVEDTTLDAVLHGALDGNGTPAAQATRWRDAGGRLEVQGLTLRWGPTAASAAATLALDAALQPSGAGTLRIANPSATLDALGAAGTIPARSLAMARRFLPLMTRLDPAGGSPVIELPVTLEDRALMVARLPVLRVEAVEW